MSEEKTPTPYDVLLEDNKKLHERIDTLFEEVSEFRNFATSLLNVKKVEKDEKSSNQILNELKEVLTK